MNLSQLDTERARLEHEQVRRERRIGLVMSTLVICIYAALFLVIAPYFHGWRP